MPSLRQMVVTGKTTPQMPPADSILQHVAEVQKRGNILVTAIAPIGDIELGLSDENDGESMNARAPLVFTAARNPNFNDDLWAETARIYEDLEGGDRSLLSQIEIQERTDDDNFIPGRRPIGSDEDVIQVTSDPDWVYVIFKKSSFDYWLNHIKNYLSVLHWRWDMQPGPIGLGGYSMQEELLQPPHMNVRFGGYESEIFVNLGTRNHRIEKKIAQYQWILGRALYELASAWGDLNPEGPSRFKGFKPVDWTSMAAVLMGSYGGWDGQVALEDDLMGKEYGPMIMQLLGLPFSQGMPYVTFQHPIQGNGQHKIISKLLMVNILLGIAAQEVGGHTQTVHYHLTKGTLKLARWGFPFFMKMPVTYGGTQSLWLHPFTNVSLSDGMLLPMAMREKGHDTWIKQDMREEGLDTVMVDRGEIPIGDLKEARYKNFRYQFTRDGRVTEVWYNFDTFVVVRWPIMRETNRATGLDLVASYLTGGSASPRRALFVNHRALESQASFVAGPVSNMIDTFIGSVGGRLGPGQDPIPGGMQAGKPPIDLISSVQGAPHVGGDSKSVEYKSTLVDASKLPTDISAISEGGPKPGSAAGKGSAGEQITAAVTAVANGKPLGEG